MAYRNNFSIKNDRNNRISSLMNRLDHNLLSDLSSINSNYSSNNLLENYKYQNNYSITDFNTYEENEQEEFSNFLSESNEEDDKQHQMDLNVLLKLERKRRKSLENRLKQLQTSFLKKKQLHDNEKLCKKLSNSLTNSLQNRRFDGDGSEDDEMTNTQTKSNLISKNKVNFQTTNYQNNSPNNFRSNNSYQSNHQTNDLNDLNDLNQYSTNNLKFKEIDKLIKIIKRQQDLNDLNGQMNKNFINDECSNSLNEFNSRNLMKNIKNNLVNNTAHSSLDNQSSKSLDCTPNPINNNDLYFNETNLKKQIIQSMKSNFNSMIEFIENQSFSQDNFMAIQQLINLILMQNCQFMNHQQVLLCWLQKLQFQLCTSRSNQSAFFSNNLNNTDATGDSTGVLFTDSQLNDQLSSTNSQQLNNSNLKLASTLNNQQIEPSIIKTSNNFYDNLKSHPSLYQNQLSSKVKNSAQNFKLNNKLNKGTSDKLQQNSKTSIDFKELYNYLIEKMNEDKQNATGKLNYHQEFDEPGAVGGEEKIDLDLNENLHNNLKHQQSSTANGNLGANNNLNSGNHLSNGINNLNGTNTSNNNSSSANKSPQMIIHLPSSSSAVRKKTTVRKNPDVIESISCSDDLIKNSTESVRPLMAAEGRSCEFNPATTILQNQVNQVKTINSSTKISSTSAISTNPIVAAAASSTNSNSAHVLLKRPPTTGAARRFDQDDDNDDTEETSDDDLANQNQTSEVLNSSENENNVNSPNLPNSNTNAVPFVESSSTMDPEQQIDEQLGFPNAHLNGRNDSEIRLSGDGEQGL